MKAAASILAAASLAAAVAFPGLLTAGLARLAVLNLGAAHGTRP
jgi:hypothetical protein